jgi:hypothetical protein
MRCDVTDNADAKPGVASDTAIETETTATADAAAEPTVTVADETETGDVRDDEADDDGETSDADGPKPRRSRSRRYKDRIDRLERELADARAHVVRPSVSAFADDLVEPNERDFPNDYLAYDRALREYQTRKVIRDEHRRQAERQAAVARHVEQRERVDSYQRRLESVRERIPDFAEVMRERAGEGAAIRNDVRDLVMESPKGPLLAYYLATNPDVLDDINAMSPAAAAKTIGSLEARIRGPRPKLLTDARPSRGSPQGGTSSGAGKSYADMSMEEFIAARQREQRGA